MLTKVAVLLLGLFIVAISGCASSESSKTVAIRTADVNGTWQGGITGGAATVTMILNQTGTNVTGTLSGAGTLDGPIKGTVDGNTIRLATTSGSAATPLLGVRGNQIDGNFDGRKLSLHRISANVTGRWTGYHETAQGGVVTMNLTQTGDKVVGDIDIAGRPDLSGPITGTVRGHTVELDSRSGYASAPVLTVNGNQIAGVVGAGPVNLTRSQ